MFSSSRWIASGCGLALALSFTIAEEPLAAQGTAQDTAHKKETMQMPMNMPMGKKAQKRKAGTAKSKKTAVGKKTRKASSKPAAGRPAAKTMAMPKEAPPHHAPIEAGQMQMGDSSRAMHVDSAHRDMGAMRMQPA